MVLQYTCILFGASNYTFAISIGDKGCFFWADELAGIPIADPIGPRLFSFSLGGCGGNGFGFGLKGRKLILGGGDDNGCGINPIVVEGVLTRIPTLVGDGEEKTIDFVSGILARAAGSCPRRMPLLISLTRPGGTEYFICEIRTNKL